jgi:methionyl-tRNA synthetase
MPPAFYITTTLPYVNAEPHIGFALEIVAADVIARFQASQGKEVFFNTGTDEHGQKIYEKALAAVLDPKAYCDQYATKFADLKHQLNLSEDLHFIRTTDSHHIKAAQTFWQRCAENDDIYKRQQVINYCIGCEMEKQLSELVEGRCPLHPTQELEIREEENYFFRFSKYQQQLLNLYENNPEFVKPASKLKEISTFVSGGLQDFSVSRLKTKMPWGVPVPGDEDHVMYVWFDALVNYISTLGWPDDDQTFNRFWPGVQIAGKDNLRPQSAMWQAMLMSAGLPASKQILINGFISVDGQKMSKSLGNVISPNELTARYGIDATRYLLMFLGPVGDDMDVTWDRLDTIYTAELANALGNTCSRVAKLCEKAGLGYDESKPERWELHLGEVESENEKLEVSNSVPHHYHQFEIKSAVTAIGSYIKHIEEKLSQEQPWKQTGETQAKTLRLALNSLLLAADLLMPLMPEVAEKIGKHFQQEKIEALQPLFPRLA